MIHLLTILFMQEKNKAILFDLDGTLLNSGLTFLKIVNILKSKKKQGLVDFEMVRKYSSRGAYLILKHCFPNETEESLSNLRAEFLDYYEDMLVDNLILYDGIDSMLNKLDEKQVPWGIVTNKSWKYTKPIIDEFGWDKRTPAIICPDHLKNSKPDPEGINLALSKLNAKNTISYYVGDHQRDIEAGKNAGTLTIACDWGYWEDDCNTWNADLIVSHPDGIIEWIF